MAFPSNEDLKKIRESAEKSDGTLGLLLNPTSLQKFRWDICQQLIKYANKRKLKNLELAEIAEITEADMSRILHHRIDGMSTDRLILILAKIRPKHQIELKVG